MGIFLLLVVVVFGTIGFFAWLCDDPNATSATKAATAPLGEPAPTSAANTQVAKAPPEPIQRPAPTPLPEGAKLSVLKAMGQFDQIARSYSRATWSNREDIVHDLTVMAGHGDLRSLSLEFLGNQEVLMSVKIDFKNSAGGGSYPDFEQGTPVPVVDASRISGDRVIVYRGGQESKYKYLLKLNWSPAHQLPTSIGAEFSSLHTARITGGRQAATIHVAAVDRRGMMLTGVGPRGFGFARSLDGKLMNVFISRNQLPPGMKFEVGSMFTSVVVQTPRGLQARSIAAA